MLDLSRGNVRQGDGHRTRSRTAPLQLSGRQGPRCDPLSHAENPRGRVRSAVGRLRRPGDRDLAARPGREQSGGDEADRAGRADDGAPRPLPDLYGDRARPAVGDRDGRLAATGAEVTTRIHAPIAGIVCALEQVPDPVFAQKIVGDGLAIEPLADRLLAPFDAEIVPVAPTGHSVTLRSAAGTEMLLHTGIDTVDLGA